MKVKKTNLLLLAGIVWSLAGVNILRIGILCYLDNLAVINFAISALVFALFWFLIFSRLVHKHTGRITGYEEERQFFLKFFDGKSFLIMAFMMTFGITIRTLKLWPDRYIAVFYTGLGAALFLAGLLFTYNYINYAWKTVEYERS